MALFWSKSFQLVRPDMTIYRQSGRYYNGTSETGTTIFEYFKTIFYNNNFQNSILKKHIIAHC